MVSSNDSARQRFGSEYQNIKSLVCRIATETRTNTQLSTQERDNLQTYLRFKGCQPQERRSYLTSTSKLLRRGFVHLPELRGTPGVELEHAALEDRFDEIEDVVIRGDRLWSVFTLQAKHVGELYGRPATNKNLSISEVCRLRFENGKIADAWFFGDEISICKQIGISVNLPHFSSEIVSAPAVPRDSAKFDVEEKFKHLVSASELSSLTDEEERNIRSFLTFLNLPKEERLKFFETDANWRGQDNLFLLPLGDGDAANAKIADYNIYLEDLIAQGDRLWSVSTIRANHSGALNELPLAMLVFTVMRFKGGKIAEFWNLGDTLGLYRQMGAVVDF
jgi:predicted ester cyclase